MVQCCLRPDSSLASRACGARPERGQWRRDDESRRHQRAEHPGGGHVLPTENGLPGSVSRQRRQGSHGWYLHISKNTFLELGQAGPQRPAGFTHYGLHVDNAKAAVARFRANGVMVSDTNTSDTKAILANITDPYMGRIELAELTPESLHNKAIQSWK